MTAPAGPSAPGRGAERHARGVMTSWLHAPVMVPVYAVLLSVVAVGALMAVVGEDPFAAYWALLRGMFGSWDRIAGSVARSVPFIGAALALAIPFRAGLFNIGAEGQLLIGGVLAAWVGTWSWVADVPGVLAVSLVVLGGMVGGTAWGAVPGILKAKTGAHEVITTIMLNAIALFAVRWMVSSTDPVVLRAPESTAPRTAPIAENAHLPVIVESSQPDLHWGLFLLLAACVFTAFLLDRTTYGFEVTTVGKNPHAARYAGMGVERVVVGTMAIAGTMAGLSAASEVAGTTHYFQPGTFAAMGFDGIAIALLARGRPMHIILASLLWGSMLSGAPLMQQDAGVSIDVVRIIQSMVLLFVAADAVIRYLFRIRDDEPVAEGEVVA